MPGGDASGPRGQGPGTGRRAGFCFGFSGPGYLNPGYPNWRIDCGRGWRHRFWATGTPGWAWTGAPYEPVPPYQQQAAKRQTDKQFLQEQVLLLENQLEELKRRIALNEDKEEENKEDK